METFHVKPNMKKLHLIWAFIFVGNFCFSQETRVVNIDSLLMHLNASQEGAKTVDAYTTQISKVLGSESCVREQRDL